MARLTRATPLVVCACLVLFVASPDSAAAGPQAATAELAAVPTVRPFLEGHEGPNEMEEQRVAEAAPVADDGGRDGESMAEAVVTMQAAAAAVSEYLALQVPAGESSNTVTAEVNWTIRVVSSATGAEAGSEAGDAADRARLVPVVLPLMDDSIEAVGFVQAEAYTPRRALPDRFAALGCSTCGQGAFAGWLCTLTWVVLCLVAAALLFVAKELEDAEREDAAEEERAAVECCVVDGGHKAPAVVTSDLREPLLSVEPVSSCSASPDPFAKVVG